MVSRNGVNVRNFTRVLVVIGLSAACELGDDPSLDAGRVDAGRALNAMPSIADLEGETWHAVEPGGDTICSRGQPWAFFFRPGVVNKLVVEFQGGGACCPVQPGRTHRKTGGSFRQLSKRSD